MIKKMIIPIIFALAGTSFVTYSFLDTFIIAKTYDLDVSFDFQKDDAASYFSFSFAEMESEPQSSSSENILGERDGHSRGLVSASCEGYQEDRQEGDVL